MTGRPRTCEKTRFWSFVEKSSGCWLWTGGKLRRGYGAFQISQPRRTVRAHRMSYALEHGIDIRELDAAVLVRHTCDNPPCVNPKHLCAGTTQDNVNDKMRRGRFIASRPSAILQESDIPTIRRRLKAGDLHREIASDYGVCRETISQIARGANWKLITRAAEQVTIIQ